MGYSGYKQLSSLLLDIKGVQSWELGKTSLVVTERRTGIQHM